MLASFLVQNMLQRRFEKYSKVPLTNGMTGAEVARKMMNDNGIYDVKVECIPGMLTDHYNPATKTVNLSGRWPSMRSNGQHTLMSSQRSAHWQHCSTIFQ